MTDDAYTLNEAQLKALVNLRNLEFLEPFTKPTNPSEAARRAGVAANTMHYHVKNLEQVGILEIVAETGNRRRYQLVATRFRLPKELVPVVLEVGLGLVDSLFGGLHHQVKKLIERRLLDALTNWQDSAEPDAITFDFDNFNLSPDEPSDPAQGGIMNVQSTKLSREGYGKVMRALSEALETVQNDPEGETYTIAVITYPGKLTD